MAQVLPVYAVVSLLIVASVGPVLAEVRDASLQEFAELDRVQPLEHFPFLKEMRPHLPPLVVEWIIIKKGEIPDLPPGLDYRLDDHGRVIVVWPDGCEESHQTYQTDSTCAPDPCTADPSGPGCDPCRPPEGEDVPPACLPPEPDCPAGHIPAPDDTPGDPDCIPDPACQDPNGDGVVPDDCPVVEPVPQPCGGQAVEAYDGTCIPLAPSKLSELRFGGLSDTKNVQVELKVPYHNLSLELEYEGIPRPDWNIKLFYTDGSLICWIADGGSTEQCELEENVGVSTEQASYHDTVAGAIAAGNLTLHVEYVRTASSGDELTVRLYGMPADGTDDT